MTSLHRIAPGRGTSPGRRAGGRSFPRCTASFRTFLSAAAIVATAATTPASAATLIVDGNGILTGATGVIVDGASYDVVFRGGTCTSAFGACTAANFAFTNVVSATAASNALLDQVVIDGPGGQFDSDPSLTLGCSPFGCQLMVPYATTANTFQYVSAVNNNSNFPDMLNSGSINVNYNTDNTAGVRVFAVFSNSVPSIVDGAVPEPATWAMMVGGFGAIGFAMRRRRKVGAAAHFA